MLAGLGRCTREVPAIWGHFAKGSWLYFLRCAPRWRKPRILGEFRVKPGEICLAWVSREY